MRRSFTYAVAVLFISTLTVTSFAADDLHTLKKNQSIGKIYERTIEFFTKKIPQAFEEKLANAYQYLDIIIDVFDEKGIPSDIAYLPLIESGFSPAAVGSGDAVGLWQFVKTTGKRYGLRIDRYVDERKDPVKSTHAAARYLKDLYGMFGTWDLALAAYNAGEGKVKNIYKSKSANLPDVINRYLAKLIAVATIARDPERYGLKSLDEIEYELVEHREIVTDKVTALKALADQYKTSVKLIKELNPALLTEYTPPYPYKIRLPNP